MQTPIRPVDRRVEMSHARREGVGFVEIRGLRGAEEVEFAIAGERGDGIDLALDQQRQAALALGQAPFGGMADFVVGEGNRAEIGVDVRFHIVVAIHAFESEEAAGGDRQALVAKLAGRAGEDFGLALPGRDRNGRKLRLGLSGRLGVGVDFCLEAPQFRLQSGDFGLRIIGSRRRRGQQDAGAERQRREQP